MKFVMYQDCLSPHQLPLARELVKLLGADNFRYVYRDDDLGDRVGLGWEHDATEPWAIHIGSHLEEAQGLIENADILLMMFRDVGLMARRAAKGLMTLYDSERWLKPIPFCGVHFPGRVRLLLPRYRKMVKKFIATASADPNFRYLPIGPWAANDMAYLGLSREKMIPWGYFVDSGHPELRKPRLEGGALRILWVGRMLRLKRVDTIIRAVRENVRREVALTLVGDGPEKPRLQKMAQGLPVTFLPSQPIEKIRELMREHDVFVFASNGFDGWGAVVSEAVEEGMAVLGTRETGASAAILPESNLFPCGDYRALAEKLSHPIPRVPVGPWSAAEAAKRLLREVKLEYWGYG